MQTIRTDVNIEEVKATFLDEKFVNPPDCTFIRVDLPGGRYYCEKTEKAVLWRPSVTTIVDKYHKVSPYLAKWREKDPKAADQIFWERGRYGTFIHSIWGQILQGLEINLRDSDLILNTAKFAEREQFDLRDIDLQEWIRRAKQDTLGFVLFCQEHKVRPYCIEQTYRDHKENYAGTIDFVGLIKVGSKVIPALVDFKSTRTGEWDDHPIQLEGYRGLWNMNNPNLPITRSFIYYAREWDLGKLWTNEAKPYKLKEQTTNPLRLRWYMYLAMHQNESGEFKPEPLYAVKQVSVNIQSSVVDAIEQVEINFPTPEKKKKKKEKKNERADKSGKRKRKSPGHRKS